MVVGISPGNFPEFRGICCAALSQTAVLTPNGKPVARQTPRGGGCTSSGAPANAARAPKAGEKKVAVCWK